MSNAIRDLERVLYYLSKPANDTNDLRLKNERSAYFLKTHGEEVLRSLKTLHVEPKRRMSKHGKACAWGLTVNLFVSAALGLGWAIVITALILALILLFEGGFLE